MMGYEGEIINTVKIKAKPVDDKEAFIVEEISCRLLFMHGGELVHESSQWNDFYGKNMSIKHAIDECFRLCEAYQINKSSSLYIVVEKLISHSTCYEIPATSFSSERFERVKGHYGEEVSREIVWSTKGLYGVKF